jgi:hypothetical protein
LCFLLVKTSFISWQLFKKDTLKTIY